jgi:hypothetical protein
MPIRCHPVRDPNDPMTWQALRQQEVGRSNVEPAQLGDSTSFAPADPM